jgi:streptogramin lyase
MYVVTSDGVLHVFDPATGALVTTMPVNADAEAASSSANFLSVDPYTGKLYVSNTWNGSSWSDQVNVFDGTEPDGVFNIPRPGNGAVDNERGLMYVTTTNGAMGVIDINTGQVVETFALPGGSAGFPFVDPATGKVYVVGYLPDSTTRTGIGVWVIDPDAHTVQLVNEDYDAGTPAGLENATFGDGKVTYIREDDYLDDGFVTYDPATDSVTVYTVPFDIDMRGMVFANDQNVIYVGGYNEDDDPALFMYDPNNTANPLTEVPANLDEYISDFDYDANNHILYGVDVNNNLVAYNTDTWGDPIFTDNLGSIPYDLKIGSKCVYE